MSSRFNKALSAGKVVLMNRGNVSTSILLFRTEKRKGRRIVTDKSVKTLAVNRRVVLTRKFSIEDLRFSLQNGNLKSVLANRKIDIEDTWSE